MSFLMVKQDPKSGLYLIVYKNDLIIKSVIGKQSYLKSLEEKFDVKLGFNEIALSAKWHAFYYNLTLFKC